MPEYLDVAGIWSRGLVDAYQRPDELERILARSATRIDGLAHLEQAAAR
jgi:multiple sugar transport system substrate-binding protein